jgi:type IX secretion system PorP/SprF family membrane protein
MRRLVLSSYKGNQLPTKIKSVKTFVMRTITFLVSALMLSWSASAQQEQMYTQFMFNKLAFNPGYAGSFSSPTLTTVYRQQWVGLEGAPSAQVLSYSQPFLNNRVGLGGTIMRQQIGISTNLTVDFAYAYRVKLKRGTFAFGLQVSTRNIRQNWADPRIVALDQQDEGIPTEPKSKLLPNFGTGFYYVAYKDKWFVGLSAPRLVANSIDVADFGTVFSREVQHINMMGGITFKPNDMVQITPQALFRYAAGAPLDAEMNVSVLLRKKIHGGLTYRVGGDTKGWGESVDVMLGLQVTDHLLFCLSYDVGMTSLRKFNDGSVEATARWWFSPPDDVTEVGTNRPF